MNSALTAKLLGHLHRIFDKDPARELALRIRYPSGTLSWSISDGILSTVVYPQTVYSAPLYLDGSWPLDGSQDLDGGDGFSTSNLSLDLSQYTIDSLAAHIGARGGYAITYTAPAEISGLSALALLDGDGDQAESNGDHLYCYTSLLWSYISSLSAELATASVAIVEMLKQMSLRTAEGEWLDELGSYYKVPRILGESDLSYGPRIIAETLRPKGNNMAIAAAIKEATGMAASVVDCALLPEAQNYYDGTWAFDGSRRYAVHDVQALYGLFDVLVQYDLLGESNVTEYLDSISEQVNRLRDAGTFMRQIGISGDSAIADYYDMDFGDSAELTIRQVWYFDGSVRFDGSAEYGSRVISTEQLGADAVVNFTPETLGIAQIQNVTLAHDFAWSIDGDFVANDYSLAWSIDAPLSVSQSFAWLVDGTPVVAASQDVAWTVYAQVTETQSLSWSIEDGLTYSFVHDITWSIGDVVSSSQSITWSIDGALSSAQSIAWSIGSLVTADFSCSWEVGYPIAQDLNVSWEVGYPIAQDLNVSWEVGYPIATSLNVEWSILN